MKKQQFTKVRRALAAATIVASTLLLTPAVADARIKDSDRKESSVSLNCGYLQDRWDALARELETASRTGTQAQYDRVFGQMLETARQWNQLCRADYGSIVYRIVNVGTTPMLTGGQVQVRRR